MSGISELKLMFNILIYTAVPFAIKSMSPRCVGDGD